MSNLVFFFFFYFSCISGLLPRLQAIGADFDSLQAAAAGSRGEAADAAAADGTVAGSRGPLVLPQQLRATMQSLRDAAAAELAELAEVAEVQPHVGRPGASSDVDDGAASDAGTDADAGDGDDGKPQDPEGWDPSEWADDADGIPVGSRAIRDGVDMADLWRLPGMITPPDVPVEQWPRLLHALDVLCSNVMRQVHVRNNPPPWCD